MIAHPPHPDHLDHGALFARTVLTIASQVEADEAAIKAAILAAARAGDTARVIAIVEAWQRLPPGEVLAAKLSAEPLALMREPEVTGP